MKEACLSQKSPGCHRYRECAGKATLSQMRRGLPDELPIRLRPGAVGDDYGSGALPFVANVA